ncbi:MAG: dihydrodipicolinate synthase family protein [Steroidobacteraceae bacterium]
MTSAHVRPFRGVFAVAPTPFSESGEVDFLGQGRVLDCMADQGVDGLCILANFSEQFSLTDGERESLVDFCLEHVAGRLPVIVTCSHFSTRVAAERARRAAARGASLIMLMPPYHGATMRADEDGLVEHLRRVAEGCGLPIMLQDAPLSGTQLSAELLARIAREVPAGRSTEAAAAYARVLPLINFENRQCGLRATKAVMAAGGVIRSDATRHPVSPLSPATRAALLELAREVDPVVLRWGR